MALWNRIPILEGVEVFWPWLLHQSLRVVLLEWMLVETLVVCRGWSTMAIILQEAKGEEEEEEEQWNSTCPL